jgi:hypothetical protein
VTNYRELAIASRIWLSPTTFNTTKHLLLTALLIALSLTTGETVAVAQTNSRFVRERVHHGHQNAPAIDIQKLTLPPDIDEHVPPASHEPCPLAAIMEGANKRAKELVFNLQRFTATEILQSANVRKSGHAGLPETRKMTYVAEFQDSGTGLPSLEEYRDSSRALPDFDTNVATTGTAMSALIFHPSLSQDFAFDCEGATEINGIPAWQVHFVQMPGRTTSFREYNVRGHRYPTRMKGRAWIAAENYQVLRIEHELQEPVPEIRLVRDYVAVDYQMVDFTEHNVQIWLPARSMVYVDLGRHRYLNTHCFQDYKLFWVDTHEVVLLPTVK